MKTIKWIIKKFTIGCMVLLAAGFLGAFIDIDIPFNYLSAFLIGSLGLPGFVMVYVTNMIFMM